jgi:hypothetical protein
MPFQKGHTKWGGKRKGSVNKKTEARMHLFADTEQALIQLGQDPTHVSPLMVMCSVMCFRLQQKDYKAAVEIAQMAAPYVHAKLNATDVNVRHSLANRSDSEVAAELAAIRAKIEAARTLPAPPIIDAEPVYTALQHADLRQPAGTPSYTETVENIEAEPAKAA